jgi:hypothetical protein
MENKNIDVEKLLKKIQQLKVEAGLIPKESRKIKKV